MNLYVHQPNKERCCAVTLKYQTHQHPLSVVADSTKADGATPAVPAGQLTLPHGLLSKTIKPMEILYVSVMNI